MRFMAEIAADRTRPQSLQSVKRALDVIQVFSRENPALTLSEVANLAGMPRATARRILLTLQDLGHVRSDGKRFSPTARVLSLGFAYLSSLSWREIAQPLMEDLATQNDESCSAATLDLPDVVYVARVPTRRIMSITLGVGRVLLADLCDADLDSFLESAELEALTERTITNPDSLRRTVEQIRQAGFALVDQELELGLRSIAAPVQAPNGRAIAALNQSTSASRVSVQELRDRFLPALLETADQISAALACGAH
jgi:IclR family transcriptional regulator, pca regulon regulatory protein